MATTTLASNRTQRMWLTPADIETSKVLGNTVLLGCCVVLCVTGNTLVLLSLKRYAYLRTPAKVILGSLAMCDLLMALPMFIKVYSWIARDFNGAHADIQAGLSTTLVATASLHIGLISIDRFISIRYALRYISVVTMTKVAKLLPLIWGISVTLVGLVMLFTATLAPDSPAKLILFYRKPRMKEFNKHDIHPWVIFYKKLLFILFFVLPFITMVTCYVYISGVAYVKRRSIRSELMAIAPVNGKNTKTIFIVVVLYSILNAPYSVVCLLQILNKDLSLVYSIEYLLVIASLASSINPYIYAYRDRHFKHAFKKILTCK